MEQYEQFSGVIQKSSVKLAFDMLFYIGMRSEELPALTPLDILPTKRVDINKNYAKVKGERIFYFAKSALEKEIKRASEKAGL